MTKIELQNRLLILQQKVNEMLYEFQKEINSLEDSSEIVQITHSDEEWLNVKKICQQLGISESTFYDHVRKGEFPQGVPFGVRSKRWKMSEIRAWIEQKNHSKFDIVVNVPSSQKRGRKSKIKKLKELQRI